MAKKPKSRKSKSKAPPLPPVVEEPSVEAATEEEAAPAPVKNEERPTTERPRNRRWVLGLGLAIPLALVGALVGDPWAPWLIGIGVATALAAWMFGRAPAEKDDEPPQEAVPEWIPQSALVAIALPFFLGIMASLEFVKDDAYISFRYAHNLVTGKGLVFNGGERVEGFTNFLWVFILAPFEWLGWDLFQVCEVLGTCMGITCIVLTARMTGWINGERKFQSQLWGALWLSTSSSFALWAKSGLEQPLAILLPIGAAFLLWGARANPKKTTGDKRYLYAGLLMGAGCLTRPDLHLLAILVGLPLVVDVLRTRKVTRTQLLYVAGILAFTIPGHAFRYFYYGSLVPNTFYVKTGIASSALWRAGWNTLHEMFVFNHLGVLALFAPLAFANRRRLVEKGTMAIIALAFMGYYARVGVDEMQWHRLYLPALPFLCALAALGAQNLVDEIVRRLKSDRMRDPANAVVWAGLLLAGATNFMFTYREMRGFNGHGDLSGTFHPDMGKFITRHERPGALVAFQDVGSTPYHAPDIDFLDFIGLVDKTVAHARHDYGLHAFIGGDERNVQPKYDADMREYFFRRRPEWAILTIYGNRTEETPLHELYESDPTGAAFGNYYRNNNFQFGIWNDSRFQNQYVPIRTWPRSTGYYLALWRRRDLAQQMPKEVVLETLPPDVTGSKATFEDGLELLGSEMSHQTIERHEVFITTWWKLPGPMPRDLYFFVHVKNDKVQVPADHIPGDWMYPADRWKPGEILEDRILFQLPPFIMKPGEYTVYIGAYRRSTGERLKVLEGGVDTERVLLGKFEARKLRPIIDQLIPPTRVEVQRKYPDRIVDPHR